MRLSVASLRWVVKRDLPIEFVPQALTSYGGLELLRRYLQRVDLPGRLRRALGVLGGDYGSARLSLLVLALLYVGGRRPHGCHRHLGVEGVGREDVDQVQIEAQELSDIPDDLSLREERGSPVEEILAAVAEYHHRRIRVVSVAETVQVEDAAEPHDADSKGDGSS